MKYYTVDNNCEELELTKDILKTARWEVRTSRISDDDINIVWVELYIDGIDVSLVQQIIHWYYGDDDPAYNKLLLKDFINNNPPKQYAQFVYDIDGEPVLLSNFKPVVDKFLLKNNNISIRKPRKK